LPATGSMHTVESMQYLWPHNLWWMLLLPIVALLYAWRLRRGAGRTQVLPALRVVGDSSGSRWQRHLAPGLMFVALALLLLALARPTAAVPLPWARSTILLAMDISRSMRVGDVQPSRMVAAQDAAKLFLSQVPPHMEVGLVTFAGTAQVAHRASIDRPGVVAAVDAIQMQFGTAIGNAIVVCLAELFPDHGLDLGEMTFGTRLAPQPLGDKARGSKPPPREITPVPPGSYESAAIILLSDGRRTTGVDTIEAAKLAADRGVRIYVVGLGTPDGHSAMTDTGMAMYLQLDEPTLRLVAQMTGGEYHHAGTAEALRNVYLKLGSKLQVSKRDTELTALLCLVAALLLAAGAGLSVLWYGRVA
jgi:Ca-activated chloride channel family protein